MDEIAPEYDVVVMGTGIVAPRICHVQLHGGQGQARTAQDRTGWLMSDLQQNRPYGMHSFRVSQAGRGTQRGCEMTVY